MPAHPKALAATAVVAALLAGCGGGGHAATTTTTTTAATGDAGVRAPAFVKAFESASGLRMDSTPNSRWTLVSPTVADTSRAIGRYGSFSVYVLESVAPSLDILLRTSKGTRLKAGARGLYYDKGGSGTYSVSELVSPNVFVRWQGMAQKRTGPTFRRLVADVEHAVAAAR